MARMPEIVGESQDSGPQLDENELNELTEADLTKIANLYSRPISDQRQRSGIIESPLLIRLIDFSGEGERAPPKYIQRPAR
ncbi:MAG: hypothetical protein ACYTBZ_04070 [Planctomycetota bacterium]|jgi:hypothetical protein